jgi:MFS family permease
MRAAVRRFRKRLGRRGHFLLILGVGKTCYGAGLYVNPPSPTGLGLLTHFSDLQHWAWLWITCGIITTVAAFLRIGRDWAGFVAAYIPPTVWAIAYIAAVVNGEYARGIYVAIWYLTSHVGVIMWASRVPEHSVPHVPRAAQEGGPG